MNALESRSAIMPTAGAERVRGSTAIVVGVGAFRAGVGPEASFIARGLGSCVGVGVIDEDARVGGLFHAMLASWLPTGSKSREHLDADRGVDALLDECVRLGADAARLRICLAGGAIGGRLGIRGIENVAAVRRALSRHGLGIEASDIGGLGERSMGVCVERGRVWAVRRGRERTLFGG